MKISFKKLVSLLAVLVMAITLVAVPNTSAKADEAATGTVHHVNAYDWTAASVYAFASADTAQNVNTMTGQPDGTFEWWTYIVLDQNADGNYEVTKVFAPAADNAGDTEALCEGRIIIMVYEACADTASYGFFTSLTEGTVLSADVAWADMAATWEALDVNFAVVEDEVVEESATAGAVHHVNAYDWTAASVYAFASADTAQNVNTMTGQPDGTFEWWTYIVLDQNADGNYEVTKVFAPAADNAGDTEALCEGRIIIMVYEACADTASYGFFTSLTEGTVLSADVAWADMAATWEALDVNFAVAEDEVVEDTTTEEDTTVEDTTTEDAGDDEEIKETGDSFVSMYVVLFAGLALIAVATVGKKRRA